MNPALINIGKIFLKGLERSFFFFLLYSWQTCYQYLERELKFKLVIYYHWLSFVCIFWLLFLYWVIDYMRFLTYLYLEKGDDALIIGHFQSKQINGSWQQIDPLDLFVVVIPFHLLSHIFNTLGLTNRDNRFKGFTGVAIHCSFKA